MASKIKPAVKQIERYQALFDYFNESLFKNQLTSPMLIFSRGRSANVCGHHSEERWKGMGLVFDEINITPLHLMEAPEIEVCQTFVHEMCHLWQTQYGKSPRAGYHDKQWANKMESIGLMPSSTGRPGGKKTGQKMSDYPILGGLFEKAFKVLPENTFFAFKSVEYNTLKRDINGELKAKAKQKNKISYRCGVCDSKVWGKPGLLIVHMNCFDIEVEGDPYTLRLMKAL